MSKADDKSKKLEHIKFEVAQEMGISKPKKPSPARKENKNS